jgi:hypothetical protein
LAAIPGILFFILLALLFGSTSALANLEDDDDEERGDGILGAEFPHIPEPMVFDLLRPLGATRGELEINNLAIYDIKGENIKWAPEIEYAIRDGLGIEFELPFDNQILQDYKLAIQGTLPEHSEHFAHGWQIIGRHLRLESSFAVDALYIAAYRFNEHWSTLNMLGFRGNELEKRANVQGLANFNLFYSINENLALGIEMNNEFSEKEWGYLLIPQVHANFTDRFSLQAGAGYQEFERATGGYVVSSRLIYTF